MTPPIIRQIFRWLSRLEKELNRQRQTLKPLKTLGFSVCPYYTVRAQLRHDRAAMRRGRKNSLHDARSQQRRLYAERLHALDQPDAAGSSANRRKRDAKDTRALKTAKTNSRLPEKSSRDSRYYLILSKQARFVPSPLASGLASMSLSGGHQPKLP